VAAKAFCPLCIVSALLVSSLFAIHVIKYWQGGFVATPADRRADEIGYAAGMSFVAVSALAAVLLFVNHLGTRGFDEGSDAEKFTSMVGRSLPRFIDAEKLGEMKPVGFNFNIPPLRTEDWITEGTPSLGTPGKINVVAFLDPNCPSCKGEYIMLESLAKRYSGQAAFYVFSRVLWDHSLLQSQALAIARDTGKYFDLWRVQLDRQRQGGLDLAAIEKIFGDLHLDTANLDGRLAAALPAVKAQRDRAIAAGINGTPTIFVDGLAVDDLSRDERSLEKLIERADLARTRGAKMTKTPSTVVGSIESK
jgi:thiol-disulfide isomerase/thioredoxin